MSLFYFLKAIGGTWRVWNVLVSPRECINHTHPCTQPQVCHMLGTCNFLGVNGVLSPGWKLLSFSLLSAKKGAGSTRCPWTPVGQSPGSPRSSAAAPVYPSAGTTRCFSCCTGTQPTSPAQPKPCPRLSAGVSCARSAPWCVRINSGLTAPFRNYPLDLQLLLMAAEQSCREHQFPREAGGAFGRIRACLTAALQGCKATRGRSGWSTVVTQAWAAHKEDENGVSSSFYYTVTYLVQAETFRLYKL